MSVLIKGSEAVPDPDQCIEVIQFDGKPSIGYAEWKFTILRYLDYSGFRGFIDGTASLGTQATEDEKLEIMRNKITAYTVLCDSLRKWLESVDVESPDLPDRDDFLEIRFDNTYNAKRLWDMVENYCRGY
ncbi:uncharacterized protein C8A04DRAFT_29947 [Dichotomopilus funicola]|uniref:Uncharacterized protein n=1 Tax=Dichotomopilus funicola TaxID=1934379 RepID=A0AAN6V0C5_9PEZI|nr:hypothetical protein C8A04DRAFT_29947 [Dichotomopilus funicola]